MLNGQVGVKQLTNNFMVSGPPSANANAKVEMMGQKTAYGYVGGINGQGLNAQGVLTISGQNSKVVANKSNVTTNVQNGIISIQNNTNIPINKRVFSANRASSLNNQQNSNGGIGYPISMQQRRRQQAVLMKKEGNYFVNKTALSHGSASSQHIGIDGITGSQGKSTGNNVNN